MPTVESMIARERRAAAVTSTAVSVLLVVGLATVLARTGRPSGGAPPRAPTPSASGSSLPQPASEVFTMEPVPTIVATTVLRKRPAVVPARGPAALPSDFSLIGYRWNPCQAVTISTAGPDISAVVGELSVITGLNLVMVSGPADITVGWGSVPGSGEIGQTTWVARYRWLISATVTIGPQAGPFWASVLRHELGHALGLNHANGSNEVMYPFVGAASPSDYQAGDRVGLKAVGASQGC